MIALTSDDAARELKSLLLRNPSGASAVAYGTAVYTTSDMDTIETLAYRIQDDLERYVTTGLANACARWQLSCTLCGAQVLTCERTRAACRRSRRMSPLAHPAAAIITQ